MMTSTTWLRRHPLTSYFVLAYGISWGGILNTGLMFLLMLLGPSTSGLMLTVSVEGRDGLRQLWANVTNWRLDLRWYAIALLTTPLLLIAILWPLSGIVDPAFAPRFQWPLFVIGIIAGSFEEIGWTGFATPRLLARQSPLKAGLGLGLVWALWHVLIDFRYNLNTMGNVWLPQFAIFYVATLTAYRVLMTWVYANTRSLLLAVLMHAAYTGWLMVIFPATSSQQSLLWQAAFAASLWAAVILACGSRYAATRQHADQPI
jgi:membrane protease YdiL (CAAX protease family)